MQTVQLGLIDYAILAIYVAFVSRHRLRAEALHEELVGLSSPPAARSRPGSPGLAFISANLGALELVGMAASGAKYGIATCHFYWVGAIPAMIFLAVFMMPFYYGSKARSVPEYLKMRFDERIRALNSDRLRGDDRLRLGHFHERAGQAAQPAARLELSRRLWICSAVVLVYVLKGGLTSAIYTEVLQFFMIVLGFAPVVYLGLKDVGGWGADEQAPRKCRPESGGAWI